MLTPEQKARILGMTAETTVYLRWGGHAGAPCRRCNGTGVQTYSDTSTWRQDGIAGQAFTPDQCDACWGSGLKDRPWPSPRRALSAGGGRNG